MKLIERATGGGAADCCPGQRLRWLRVWYRDQLCELSEVLGGRREQELIAGTGRSAEPQSVEFEDALQTRALTDRFGGSGRVSSSRRSNGQAHGHPAQVDRTTGTPD
jgi:hypothetical protein